MNINKIASWIWYNQPVRAKDLAEYTNTPDRKAKGILTYLTGRLPLYEDDQSRLYIDPDHPLARNYRLLERSEL